MDGWKLFQIVLGFLATLLGALGWDALNRLRRLEGNSMTRAEFNNEMQKLEESRRIETERRDAERASMHVENKGLFQRIELKLDDNEQKNATGRHYIGKEIAALTTTVAVLNERVERSMPPQDRGGGR